MKKHIKITTKDNFILDGIFTPADNSLRGIVFVHGMTGDKDDEGIFVRAETKLNELGFSLLRFDFRAHGESQGNSIKDFTILGELIDLEAAMSFMKNEGIEWLGLAGASFGGGIAALYVGSHKDKIKKLFLANPVLDYGKWYLKPNTPWTKKYFINALERIDKYGFIEVGSNKLKVGRKLFEEMKAYNPCEELKKYTNPLLIVHGDKDSIVAYQDVMACFNSLPSGEKELKIITGSEHGFHEEPYETEVVAMIVSFFG